MKTNARIAGNSACQDLSYWNWGRLDHYKAVMKPFFGGKRAQNNFKCSYNSYWQASFGILWSGFDQPYARKLEKTLMQWQSSLSPHSNFPLPWHGVMMRVIRIVVRSPLRNTTETHYNFAMIKPLLFQKSNKLGTTLLKVHSMTTKSDQKYGMKKFLLHLLFHNIPSFFSKTAYGCFYFNFKTTPFP